MGLSRLAGKVLTGPLAFLVAGVLDIAVFVVASTMRRAFTRTPGPRGSA